MTEIFQQFILPQYFYERFCLIFHFQFSRVFAAFHYATSIFLRKKLVELSQKQRTHIDQQH